MEDKKTTKTTKASALKNLFDAFHKSKVQNKKRQGQQKYSYYTIEEIVEVVNKILEKGDIKGQYYYLFTIWGIEVYHKDIEEPIRVVEFTEDFAPNRPVQIMSGEQQALARNTFFKKRAMEIAFCLTPTDDADKEIETAKETEEKIERNKEKKEAEDNNYQDLKSRIDKSAEKGELKDKEKTIRDYINSASNLGDTNKKALKSYLELKIEEQE